MPATAAKKSATTAKPKASKAKAATTSKSSAKTAPKATAKQVEISAEQVAQYLTAHPQFFNTHAKILSQLEMPNVKTAPSNVATIGAFQAKRAEGELEKIKAQNAKLIETVKANQHSWEQIQALILELVRAATFGEFTSTLQTRLKKNLHVDAVRLLLLADEDSQTNNTITVEKLNNLFPKQENVAVKLRTLYRDEAREIHGNHAPTVESDALILLTNNQGQDLGLLALGSTEQTHFHAGQGVELLEFFGAILATVVNNFVIKANRTYN